MATDGRTNDKTALCEEALWDLALALEAAMGAMDGTNASGYPVFVDGYSFPLLTLTSAVADAVDAYLTGEGE